MSTNGSWAEGGSGRESLLCSFFFSFPEGERRQAGADWGVGGWHPCGLFHWVLWLGGAHIYCQTASAASLAGADPACQSPARAISGMWNLGQKGGGRERKWWQWCWQLGSW